jgi:hypothetical protein
LCPCGRVKYISRLLTSGHTGTCPCSSCWTANEYYLRNICTERTVSTGFNNWKGIYKDGIGGGGNT